MAVYNNDFPNISDYKAIEEYIDNINVKLQNMFKGLSAEDNYSSHSLLLYKEESNKASALEKSIEGFKSAYTDFEEDTYTQISVLNGKIELKVGKGDVSNQFSLEKGEIIFKGNRFHVLTDNFVIDRKDNVILNGTIKADAGDIAGWKIKTSPTGGKYIEGGSGSRITVGKIETEETVGFKELRLLGNSDFRGADIELDGSEINTDRTTVFTDGFKARHVEAYGTVVCGEARARKEITCDGQIVCRKCYTSRDGSTWSDIRLKKGITDISFCEATKLLHELKPVIWHFKSGNRLSAGFIAQNVKTIEKKRKTEYGLTGESRGYITLHYAGFIAFLVKIIQQQTRELESYER